MAIVSVVLVYDTLNYLFVTTLSQYMSERYRQSLQPCVQVTGNFDLDAIMWLLYFWIGWTGWCYPFLYLMWPKKLTAAEVQKERSRQLIK